VVKTGNPFYPAKLHVPIFGDLAGEYTVDQIAGPPAFFGAPDAFSRMVHVWFLPSNNYYPDVKEGPFGWIFPYLALPALVLVTSYALFHRDRWQRLGMVLLVGVAVLVPAAWWGRFILALPAMGLVAIAVVQTDLKAWLPRAVISAAASVLVVLTYAHSTSGYRLLPSLLPTKENVASDEQRLRAEIDWLWPPQAVALREAELKEGDVVTYDSAMSFIGEAWTYDLRNRVVFVDHTGDDERWVKPRWVSVRSYSRPEELLRQRPNAFQPLFGLPRSGASMYRVVSQDF
jgi:hypothetical protein